MSRYDDDLTIVFLAGLQRGKEIAQEGEKRNQWKAAIDTELVMLELGTTETPCYTDPTKALREIIDWHIKAAIDQTVKSQSDLLDDMCKQKDVVYEERNKIVAALARLFPSGVARTTIEGWSEDWQRCVYIDLPTGQVSWHFHDSQANLFDGLPIYTKKWDGHDTPEKYRRLAALSAHPCDGKDSRGCWNVRCQLGGTCCRAAQPHAQIVASQGARELSDNAAFASNVDDKDAQATPTPKPQAGEWALTAPDGRTWKADSPLRCVSAEQRDRVPADIALARILSAAQASACPHGVPHRWPCEKCDTSAAEAQASAEPIDYPPLPPCAAGWMASGPMRHPRRVADA